MRFFKHGESLAIVLPEKLKKSSDVKQENEYEFFEVEKGTFILISKENLEEQTKGSIYGKLLKHEHIEKEQQVEKPGDISLLSKGFAVILNEEEARNLSQKLEKEIKAKNVLGVRGFDKKFYIVSIDFFKHNASKIIKLLGSRELSLKEISTATGLEEAGCNACLQVMKDAGEVIEKRRGVFKVIE